MHRIANVTSKMGPRILWKDVASEKLSDVLPNQIWTISQAMLFNVHLSPAVVHVAKKENE